MKDNYKFIAKWYDKIFEPMNSSLKNIGFSISKIKSGMNVLEIGCGTGSFLSMYQKENCSVYGVDLSASMIKEAKKKLGDKSVLSIGKAEEFNFGDTQFDLIIFSFVLHEMPDKSRKKVINDAKSLLKPDGKILVIDFHPETDKSIKGVYSKTAIIIFEFLAGRNHFLNYIDFMKKGGLPYIKDTAKLKIESKKILGSGNFGIFLLKD
ncbi:MAG: class I SAM-dependent methyltransferase [Thermodesulfobacteriota bacterium]